ncbi:hypothetical protein TRIATDRAFT_31330 [Trichoderma atroviride IMI 206040]|uniref:F-box domain-containing protein n=1 Tax=Hypocrea atroviridis (strain ATCC 20476 / IMI 206040) TaxID=452589 RepID=G9P4U0_HYPAI|nr:uncharacterized protein TRIATDRAFT_31330 [Trichoderma atroviride IMI 206040]EHK42022.1 hypothetical protein TRIATDRAFT_31330 [Trichoderma atroviride IMI 206040]
MGQIISYITGFWAVPPLLNLPTEIILLIVSHLSSSPESLVALSLTCKALSSILDRDAVKLCEKSRRQLLLLLEKDLGSRFFYCSVCCQLHHFSQQWSPITADYLWMPKSCIDYYYNKNFRPTPALFGNRNYLYGRLVMNRHLHGSPKGLPLKSLQHPTLVASWGDGPLWLETPSPRIIGDELFLCITHTLAGEAATLRDAIDEGRHGICMHVATDPVDLWNTHRRDVYRMPELFEPEGSKAQRPPPFEECRDVPGSCTVCLTDYITTIERAKVREITQCQTCKSSVNQVSIEPPLDGWSITITAYHQLGRCRDPEDWKWVSFLESPLDRILSKSPAKRDMAVYPPGVIRRKWQTVESPIEGLKHHKKVWTEILGVLL